MSPVVSVPMSAEQTERVRQWTKHLRETNLRQNTGRLFGVQGDEIVSGCCLGICLLGFKGREFIDNQHLLNAVMSRDVPQALGLPEFGEQTGNPGDVYLDWPKNLWPMKSVDSRQDPPPEWPNIGASWLNDYARCTFSQIADLVDYFGLVTT